MMTETRTPRVTYKGNPALARALALMLEEEDARGRLRRPQAADEQRDLASMLENIASGLLVWGTAEAITTAVNKLRKRFPGAGGSMTIEGDDGGDD
jgi:hypothetical protein